jgi:hypothetical protein
MPLPRLWKGHSMPSLILSRAQEAHHRTLSRAATLDNVRIRADAAAAWAKEGVAAGLREGRKLLSREFADAHRTVGEPPPAGLRSLSENPDRGHADVGRGGRR